MTSRPRRLVSLLLALALYLPVSAQAQSVFLSAGAGIITGTDVDIDTGWLAVGGVVFDIGTGGLWAGVEGFYGRNSLPDSGGDTDVSLKPYGVMGFLGYSFPTPGSVDPYLFLGAGIMGQKISGMAGSQEFSVSDSQFASEAAGGLVFGGESSKLRPYVEVRYVTDHSGLIGELLGLQLGAVLNVGP